MRSQFPHRQSGVPIPHLVIRLLFNGEDKDSFKYFLPTIIHFIKVWQDEKCICFLEMAFLQGSHLPERGCKPAQWEKTGWPDTLGYGSQGEIRVCHSITGGGTLLPLLSTHYPVIGEKVEWDQESSDSLFLCLPITLHCRSEVKRGLHFLVFEVLGLNINV